jgi:hypothetical protein
MRIVSGHGQASDATRHQCGNALVSALLALAITALASYAAVQAKRLQQKQDAGRAEATILAALQGATNMAINEQLVSLQAGQPLTKNAVTVTPVMVGPDLVWSPTPGQLAGMGYLPPGWNLTKSSLNNATYQLSFKRVPTGCGGANCGIEGQVVLPAAIVDTGTAGQYDAIVIGPILTQIGADSGVSLITSPAQITGFANTWTTANPVGGTPPGVVAVRVGTASGQFSAFVRIADSRDPNLQGNLTVAGNGSFGAALSVAGALNVTGPTTAGGNLTLRDGSGNNCVQLQTGGIVNISCAGQLNAKTGTFADGAGNTTSITPAGITATGTVTASGDMAASGKLTGDRLVAAGSYTPGSACADSNAVAGSALGNGLVLCSAGAWRAIVTQADAGDACAPEGALAQSSGAALLCRNGHYVPLTSFANTGVSGQACATAGMTAVDTATNGTLLCRANPKGGSLLWYRLQDLTGHMQFVDSGLAADSQVIAKPSCGSTVGYAGQPAIILIASAEGSSDASFNRYAVDNGASWTVYLRDNTGAPLGGGAAIAQLFCYYP